MFGIFMESLVIFKLYTGLKFLFVLTLAAFVYLLITEKNKNFRILFVHAPVLILLLFLFPVSRKLFVAAGLDGATYYRVLWTIPMGMITAYGACSFFAKHRRIGLVVTSVLIVLCGKYVYDSDYISKAENLYHIPDTVIRICELIHPDDADENLQVMVVVPEELTYYIRQYDSDIRMPYGREMIEGQWDYYNVVHAAMEETEVIDLEALIAACREEYCQYIVLSPVRKIEGDPAELGLTLLAEIDGYRVYLDPVTEETVESWTQYYEEDES
ncbi:MAG: hypothetical protein J5979_08370 [Lachnospiraceae bacterium]|nr:hypothetical protein [Lachnospiraceae bacterium]